MSYIALYPKYRPRKFDDVIGQKVIVEILKNSIINNHISHAYLFNGPRGTGKTSIAKIFARAVNCLDNSDGNYCGKCELCRNLEINDVDIVEIDAASNNGVEEIREIRSKIKLVPTIAKYKVYIIDEVHMLSTGAFNALLKTLEEPPSHVIFILATTDMHKIPLTILSRCQRFDFKKINSEEMFAKLKEICDLENKKIADSILKLIAKLSDGGCRDAINLLDQVISLSNVDLTEDEIYDLQGRVSQETIIKFLRSVCNNEIDIGMQLIDDFTTSGKNLNTIVDELLILLRNISLAQNIDSYFTAEEKEIYLTFDLSIDKIKEMTKILLELSNQIAKSTNQKNLFEIYYIYLIHTVNYRYDLNNDDDYDVNKNNVNFCDNSQVKQNNNVNESEIIDMDIFRKIRINNCFVNADKKILSKVNKDYERINDFIANKVYNNVATLLLTGKIVVASDEYLLFNFYDKSLIQGFMNNIKKIEKLLFEIYDVNFKVVCVTNDEWLMLKNEFISKKKNNIPYEFIPETNIEIKNKTSFEDVTSNVFGDDVENIN